MIRNVTDQGIFWEKTNSLHVWLVTSGSEVQHHSRRYGGKNTSYPDILNSTSTAVFYQLHNALLIKHAMPQPSWVTQYRILVTKSGSYNLYPLSEDPEHSGAGVYY